MENVVEKYAEAMFSLALEEKHVGKCLAEAQDVYQILQANPELVKLLSSAFLDRDDRQKIIDELYSSIEGSYPSFKDFILLCLNKSCSHQLPSILRKLIKLLETHENIVSGVVYSPFALSEEEVSRLEKVFSKRYGHEVHLVVKIDKNILGGIKVEFAGKMYDGSLRGKLESLKDNLRKGEK